MITLNQFLSAGLICLLLSGCKSTPTPYEPYSTYGGYSEKQHADGSFSVWFRGNVRIKYLTALDYVVLRSAVIARAHQAEAFAAQVSDAQIKRLDLGTPGIYAEKPEVALKIQFLPAALTDFMATGCVIPMEATLAPYTYGTDKVFQFNTQACIQRLQQKYQLTEQQLAATAD